MESRSCIETPPSIFIMVRITLSTLLVAFVGAVAAVGPAPDQIKNLVTFGDSYTDAVRPTHTIILCICIFNQADHMHYISESNRRWRYSMAYLCCELRQFHIIPIRESRSDLLQQSHFCTFPLSCRGSNPFLYLPEE